MTERQKGEKAKTADDEPPAPRANPDLVGHEEAERRLWRAFRSGRLAHAWLITGPRGIGKATLAYRFARFVLAGGEGGQGALLSGAAAAPPSLAVDPTHPVFARVKSGGHPDLYVLQRTVHPKTGKLRSEIVVEDAHGLRDFFTLTAAEGGWRVAVVDTADEMNRIAANAVLKILEEPPDRGVLLLVSHVPGSLLPTIRSRCRRLPLTPLSDERVVDLLARMRPDLAPDDARRLARLAEGSPGEALALAGRDGLDLYRDMVALLTAMPETDVAALHGFADRLARKGGQGGFAVAMTLLSRWLARTIAGVARGRPAPEIVPGEAEAGRRLLAAGSLDQWVELWENTNRLVARVEQVNLDRKQAVLSAFTAIEQAARA